MFNLRNKVWTYSIFINARYDAIQQKYVWPSSGKPVTQYPPTYNVFNNHYTGSMYTWRTTPLWILNFADSKSYYESFESYVKSNSILCLHENLL